MAAVWVGLAESVADASTDTKMEPLWSTVVPTGGNRSQIAQRRNLSNKPKALPSVATACGLSAW
jgi:hypothetical protein